MFAVKSSVGLISRVSSRFTHPGLTTSCVAGVGLRTSGVLGGFGFDMKNNTSGGSSSCMLNIPAFISFKSFHSPAYKRHLVKQKQLKKATSVTFHNKTNDDSGAASVVVEDDSVSLDPKNMKNDTLVTLGSLGNFDALEEVLLRHIMIRENMTREEAEIKFAEVEAANKRSKILFLLPYYVGIGVAITASAASFPMVFDYNSVHWFNHLYVTADVPEPKDLETWLEVGSWAWSWMEPVMGQISFVLLCLQYSRAQLQNIGSKPYTGLIKHHRAKKLANSFPQYKRSILMNYSMASPLS